MSRNINTEVPLISYEMQRFCFVFALLCVRCSARLRCEALTCNLKLWTNVSLLVCPWVCVRMILRRVNKSLKKEITVNGCTGRAGSLADSSSCPLQSIMCSLKCFLCFCPLPDCYESKHTDVLLMWPLNTPILHLICL
ncbi:hypothetical protein QQF64_002912 [Cirrhinus molitorella]|uniref:Uncharacterized protein n=1 Tax=Cirrhinus molitorella TaxID=172907 RepID=A0ABR3MRI7_9TELE